MSREEIVNEIRYMLERGVPPAVGIVLHILLGSLLMDDVDSLAIYLRSFAKQKKDEIG